MSIIRGNWYDTEVCDSCSMARAKAVFILKSGNALYACSHHAARWERQGITDHVEECYTAPVVEENRAVGAVH